MKDPLPTSRHDHHVVIEFLNAVASSMAEVGLLQPRDSEDLRLCVRNLHRSDWEHASALVRFNDERSEFLAQLLARYGQIGLYGNLLRLSMRGLLLQSLKSVQDFGSMLVEKAQLHFNRSFPIHTGVRYERRALFSSLLIELADATHESARLLSEALEDAATLSPTDIPVPSSQDIELDEKVAQILGFEVQRRDSAPLTTDMRMRRRISFAFASLAEALTEFLEQFPSEPAAAQIETIAETMRSEAARLGSLKFPKTGPLESWELRRHTFLQIMANLNESLRHLAMDAPAILVPPKEVAAGFYPETVRRQMTLQMVQKGQAHSVAIKAADALLKYVRDQNVTPSAILEAELTSIHPGLMPECLVLLRRVTEDESLSHLAGREKSVLLDRSKYLSKQFQNAAAFASKLALACAMTGLMGCGLKTAPKSDIVSYRPEIPFRAPPESQKPASPPVQKKETTNSGS